MMRCITEVSFAQTEANGDGRNLSFTFDFCHTFEGSDTWADFTNQLKVIFPKNIYVIDTKTKNKISLGGTTGDYRLDNLFRRGDKMSLKYGYYTYDINGVEKKDITEKPIFEGFISKVASKKPILLECEDNMWLLKQVPCKPQTWTKSLEDLFKELLTSVNNIYNVNFTINVLTETKIGAFQIGNETVCQLLARLRKEYHLEAYFRGNELRIGSQVYIESEAVTHNFTFQKNIISDQLEFQRKDDVKLSAVCNSIKLVEGKTNKKGQTKIKEERVQVLVFTDEKGKFRYTEKKKDQDFPPNEEGERRTLFFLDTPDPKTLAQLGANELIKYYYTGLKGSFTTFGIPYVKQGDNVQIKDPVLPDRDGIYKVKGVTYSGGINGHRQTIQIHYKMIDDNGKAKAINNVPIIKA